MAFGRKYIQLLSRITVQLNSQYTSEVLWVRAIGLLSLSDGSLTLDVHVTEREIEMRLRFLQRFVSINRLVCLWWLHLKHPSASVVQNLLASARQCMAAKIP